MRSSARYAIILLGSLLIAAGTNFFLVPYKILDGGIIGIALIINYMSGAKIGLAIVLCSLPIFLLAWLKERDIFYNSVLGLLTSSFSLNSSDRSSTIFCTILSSAPSPAPFSAAF